MRYLCSFLFLVGVAHARTSKVAVLEVVGAGTPEHLAHLTDVARATMQSLRPDVLVLTRDNLQALLPPGVELADCDAECEVDAGRIVGADWVVAPRIASAGDGSSVSIMIYDTGQGLLVGYGTASGAGQEAIVAAVRTAVYAWQMQAGPVGQTKSPEQSGTGHGNLDLSMLDTLPDLASARVMLDGMPLPPGRRIFTLRQGMHRLHVEHPCRHLRASAVRILPGQTVRLPPGALVRCPFIEVVGDRPDTQVRVGDGVHTLPQSLLVQGKARTLGISVPDGLEVATVVHVDDGPRVRVTAPEPTRQVTIRGAYRSGSPCRAPLSINGTPMGPLPWTGPLTWQKHRFETRCRLPIRSTLTVHRNSRSSVELAEPFGETEGYTLLGENASMLALGGRLWFPRVLDTFHLGLGLQLGASWSGDLHPVFALELPIAFPGRWMDWVIAPAFGPNGGLRTFGRFRIDDFLLDLGVGFRLDNQAERDFAGGVLLGIGYIR